MQKNLFTAAAIIFSLSGNALHAQSETELAEAVTIIHGGTIYTGLDDIKTVEALAFSDGEIIAVGEHEIVASAAGEQAIEIDLQGLPLYPGFVDAHAHFLAIGMRELTLNLEGTASVEELVLRVAAEVQKTPAGATVAGRGWIETGWPEGRMPNRIDLDPVSRDNPVILGRADGHAVVVNSAALEAAGIDDDTPDPDGGKIERDEFGRATGILIDRAEDLVSGLIEAPSRARKRDAYLKASEVYSAYGWTGVHNMSVDPDNVPQMEKMSDEGVLDIRVYNSIDQSGLEDMINDGPRNSENGRIITRAMKLYIDGALGSRGAALHDPYHDRPETSGLLLMNEGEAKSLFSRALYAGIQVNTHAIGDRGNTLVLDWYEEILSSENAPTDQRWRIEHAQIVRPADINRFAELGIIPSMQPSHAIGDLFFAPDRLGPNRLDGAYAWRALIDSGSIIAAGSDAPVERGDPLIEFYAAVARRGLDGTQTKDWRPEQAVTREEALKMFTLWPAYASFQDDKIGTIEPGKRADFTVFSSDIMLIAEEKILDAKPVMTIVDGEVVFDARNSNTVD